jgi:hypothetical protein
MNIRPVRIPGCHFPPNLIQSAVIHKEALVDKALLTFTKVIGTAALLFVGYTFIASLPDLKRYIRISTM